MKKINKYLLIFKNLIIHYFSLEKGISLILTSLKKINNLLSSLINSEKIFPSQRFLEMCVNMYNDKHTHTTYDGKIFKNL